MTVWVTLRADAFWHRVVRLDQKIAVPIPREGLNAVSRLNVGFGAEEVFTYPGHFVTVDLNGQHLDLQDGLEHIEGIGGGGRKAALLFCTNRIEHRDLAGTDRPPRLDPLVFFAGVPQLCVLGRVGQTRLTAWNVAHRPLSFSAQSAYDTRLAGQVSSCHEAAATFRRGRDRSRTANCRRETRCRAADSTSPPAAAGATRPSGSTRDRDCWG